MLKITLSSYILSMKVRIQWEIGLQAIDIIDVFVLVMLNLGL